MMQRCLAVVKSHSCNPQTTKEDAFKQGNGMSFGFQNKKQERPQRNMSVLETVIYVGGEQNDEKTRAWNVRDNNMGP